MRRRKPKTWVQVNLRIQEELRRQLATAAEANQVSFNEEVRARLIDSFDQKTRQSLASFLAEFERNARDIIERNAREFARNADDMELIWRRLAALGASMKGTYAGVEETLLRDMQDSDLRELVRGKPDEAKSKTKSTQQHRGKGANP
jgi:hypothetical protein